MPHLLNWFEKIKSPSLAVWSIMHGVPMHIIGGYVLSKTYFIHQVWPITSQYKAESANVCQGWNWDTGVHPYVSVGCL